MSRRETPRRTQAYAGERIRTSSVTDGDRREKKQEGGGKRETERSLRGRVEINSLGSWKSEWRKNRKIPDSASFTH